MLIISLKMLFSPYINDCVISTDADNFEKPPFNWKTGSYIAGLSVSVDFDALLIATVVFFSALVL